MKTCNYCGQETGHATVTCAGCGTTEFHQEGELGGVLSGGPAAADETVPATACIEYEAPGWGQSFTSFNLGFQGNGSIEVQKHSVIFSGKQRQFFFRRKATVSVADGQILNVERSGRQIRFSLDSAAAEKEPMRFSFTAETEEEAGRIERRLPQTKTAEFVKEKGACEDFQARLNAATPRVFVGPVIIGINILIFVLMAAAGAGLLGPSGDSNAATDVYLRWGANFGPLTTEGQGWRLLTSAFIHFGILHLLLNMWAFFVAGRLAERLYGNGFFLLLYLAAAITGSLASVWWNPRVLSAGASGAVFGVYGALLAYLFLHRKSVPARILAPLQKSTLGFIGYNVIYGMVHPGIDNAAHLGGLMGGAVFGLILARPLEADLREAMARSRLVAGLLTALVLPAMLWLQGGASGEEYQQQQRLQAELEWFIAEEKSIQSGWEEWRRKVRSGPISDREVARFMEPVATRWEKVCKRLTDAEHDGSPLSERRVMLRQYAGLRRDAAKALGQAGADGDRAKLDEFKALSAEADRLLARLNQRDDPR